MSAVGAASGSAQAPPGSRHFRVSEQSTQGDPGLSDEKNQLFAIETTALRGLVNILFMRSSLSLTTKQPRATVLRGNRSTQNSGA